MEAKWFEELICFTLINVLVKSISLFFGNFFFNNIRYMLLITYLHERERRCTLKTHYCVLSIIPRVWKNIIV